MIKKFLYFSIMFLMLLQLGQSNTLVFSQGTIEKPIVCSNSESYIKKMVFGNGFEYILKFRYSPELNTTDEYGNTIYKRTVTAVGEFFDNRLNNKESKKILTHKVKVTFTYDKNGHVKIESPEDDISYSRKNYSEKKWRIVHNYEVFNSSSQCIVSGIYSIYKSPKCARHAIYVDNSHVDIICSPNGDIGFNSKAEL